MADWTTLTTALFDSDHVPAVAGCLAEAPRH